MQGQLSKVKEADPRTSGHLCSSLLWPRGHAFKSFSEMVLEYSGPNCVLPLMGRGILATAGQCEGRNCALAFPLIIALGPGQPVLGPRKVS